MPEPVLIAILVILGVAILAIGVLKLVMIVAGRVEKRIDSAVTARLSSRHSPGEMLLSETMANFFGEESRGATQLRGNGGLVLTEDRLVFHMLVPERTITIPLEDVQSVSIVRSHLGKSVRRDRCSSGTPFRTAPTPSPGSCATPRRGGRSSRLAPAGPPDSRGARRSLVPGRERTVPPRRQAVTAAERPGALAAVGRPGRRVPRGGRLSRGGCARRSPAGGR